MSCLGCIKKVAKGTVGITKVVMGVDMSPMDKIRARRQICEECKDRDSKLFVGSTCIICGCIIMMKTQLEHEKCPKGKW